MDLALYDTARSKVVPVETRDPGKFSMYVCGPTVYDYPHVGHGRAVLTYDILRRFLESQGVEVQHVSNITDIDDKIIARANEEGRPASEVVEQYEAEWYAALEKLDVLAPHADPHATAYTAEMVELIQQLIDIDMAYVTTNTVYLRTEKVDGYGLLARQDIESLRSGARVEADEEKQSPIDFALWKRAKSGEPTWPAPWFDGRPGWHTECVVMSLDILGDGFDLHTGGLDLMFPHHENERAQAVALGKTFARHWMHHAFIEVGGEKMSKSLGNFTTLTELLETTDPRAYRMLVLRAHYRSPVEVTRDTIADAEASLRRLGDFVRRFPATATPASSEVMDQFVKRMNDDLDTPGGVAVMFSAVRDANKAQDENRLDDAASMAASVRAIAQIFGLSLELKTDGEIDAESASLVAQRDQARAEKNWAEADSLRDRLSALGWTVQDSPEGTKIHR
jgi:cysteinyl-tRNA synthetase